MWKVTVDADKCDACESCIENCPVEVFKMKDGKSVPVNMDDCTGCETCVESCEQNAITVAEM
ncbi:MAG: 4Fe-4S binding protein [bacterium]